jgi:hypothetical protein
MEAASLSETSKRIYQLTRPHIPEDIFTYHSETFLNRLQTKKLDFLPAEVMPITVCLTQHNGTGGKTAGACC